MWSLPALGRAVRSLLCRKRNDRDLLSGVRWRHWRRDLRRRVHRRRRNELGVGLLCLRLLCTAAENRRRLAPPPILDATAAPGGSGATNISCPV